MEQDGQQIIKESRRTRQGGVSGRVHQGWISYSRVCLCIRECVKGSGECQEENEGRGRSNGKGA